MEIVSLILSIAAGAFSVFTFWFAVRHDRKKDTIDAYNQLQEQVLDKLSLYMPKEIEEISKQPRSEEYKTVGHYLARIEHFCVGVREKVYDKNIVIALGNGYLNGVIWSRVQSMVQVKGKVYYQNYCWLISQMPRMEFEKRLSDKTEKYNG